MGQLLSALARVVDSARPPDLSAEAEKVKEAWRATLESEAAVQADVLAGTLDPYRTEVEHHFSVQDQQRYRGLMAAYLRLTTRMHYAGSGLRDRIPFAGRFLPSGKTESPVEWNLGAFVHECARWPASACSINGQRPSSTACSWKAINTAFPFIY